MTNQDPSQAHRDDDFGVYDVDEALAKARWWLTVICEQSDNLPDEPDWQRRYEHLSGRIKNLASNALHEPGIGRIKP